MHPSAGQQGRVDLKRGVLGGCANEGHNATLHMGQKGVLLRLVKAMHLIDEQRRALSEPARRFGAAHRLAHILDAGEHCAQGNPSETGVISQQAGQGGFAGTGRSPKDHGVHPPVGGQARQRSALPHQVRLARKIRQCPRTQPIRQRPPVICLKPFVAHVLKRLLERQF